MNEIKDERMKKIAKQVEDDEKERAMLVLAQRLSEESENAQIPEQYEEMAKSWSKKLTDLAAKHGPVVEKNFIPKYISCKLFYRKNKLIGDVRVEVGHQYLLKTIKTDKINAKKDITKAVFKLMMTSHDWFYEGISKDLINNKDNDNPELDVIINFIKDLLKIGEAGELFLDLLDLESKYSPVRSNVIRWIEKMIKQASIEGLIPEWLKDSIILLKDGLPGEETLLVSWKARESITSSYKSVLASRDEKDLKDAAHSWRLPSLDEGKEVIWKALAAKIAQAQVTEWKSIPFDFDEKIKEKCKSGLEARLIGEEVSRNVVSQNKRSL